MSDEKQKPVIVVAFANSYHKGERLPHLVRERREILNKLKTESKDYCEVVAEANSSADFLFDLMRQRQYQHRIAILHFGGHAEGGVLRFETETGQREDITAEHFAGVLKTIDSLKLVFLNGCGTQTIVEALFDAGISVVIATDSAIVDKQAARFAEEFYTGIAGGFSIEQSFEQAKNICEHLFKQNWVHKEVEVGRGISWDEEEAGTPGGRLPWGLYVAEDKKEDLHWKLEVPAAHSFVSAPKVKQPLLSPLESMLVKVFAGALIFMGIILGLGWLLGIPGPNMSGVKAESDISFPKNKFNILIYPIKEDSTNTAYTRDLYDRLVLLNADDKLNLGLMLYDESASNGGLPKFEEVQDEQVAAQYGLDMVVWGSVKPSGIVVNYIITDSMARSFKPSGQKIEPVANFSLFGKGKPGTIEGDVHDVLYYMAGMKELIGGNYFRALTYFDRINIDGGGLDEEDRKRISQIYLNKAECHLQLDNLEAALEATERALELDSTNVEGYSFRGVVLNNLGDYKGAWAAFNHIVTVEPYNASGYSNRGTAYYALEEYAAAKADFEKAIELDAKEPYAYFNLAKLYEETGLINEDEAYLRKAVETLNQLLQIDSSIASAWRLRGNLHLDLGEEDEALADYQRAVQADSTQAAAYHNMALWYLDHNSLDTAWAMAKKSVMVQEDYASGYNMLAYVCVLMGEDSLESALQYVGEAIKLDSTDGYSYSTLAEIHHELHHTDSFYHYLERAIEYDFPLHRYVKEKPYERFKGEIRFDSLVEKSKHKNPI